MFVDSYEQKHDASILYTVGWSYAKLGEDAMAVDYFNQYLSEEHNPVNRKKLETFIYKFERARQETNLPYLFVSAERAYQENRYDEAIRKARHFLRFMRRDEPMYERAWRTVGMSACVLNEDLLAQYAYQKVGDRGRWAIKSICLKANNIVLP